MASFSTGDLSDASDRPTGDARPRASLDALRRWRYHRVLESDRRGRPVVVETRGMEVHQWRLNPSTGLYERAT
jgi:hypothetical protein